MVRSLRAPQNPSVVRELLDELLAVHSPIIHTIHTNLMGSLIVFPKQEVVASLKNNETGVLHNKIGEG